MKKSLILVYLLFVLSLIGIVYAIPPPYPYFCQNMGYTYNATHCIFADGNSCELSTFYNHLCGDEYIVNLPCKQLGESVPPGYACCEGLNPAAQSMKQGDMCINTQGAWPICISCGDGVCAEINPGMYGAFENSCNCPLDCSNSSCKPNGYDYWLNPISKDFQCCEGLRKISVFVSYDPKQNLCMTLLDWTLCSSCGNNICEQDQEHFCNCPQDCFNGTCTDTEVGKDYYVKGTAYNDYAGNSTDFCTNDILTEYFCWQSGWIGGEIYSCPSGCYDGACLPVKSPISMVRKPSKIKPLISTFKGMLGNK